jgi:para-aminobenzoate synthetase/4-amino-4-deoxychorismate lyase
LSISRVFIDFAPEKGARAPIIADTMPQPAAATQSLQPDRRHGVIETFLVVDHRPVELDAHLERLRASVRAVYREEPPDLRDLVLSHARGGFLGRLRLTVAPLESGSCEAYVVAGPVEPAEVFPTRELAVSLLRTTVEGGLGEHKWADREVLERTEALGPAGSVLLLVDEGGAALEASRGNLFAVRGGRLLTPPLDGRILPGVTRARVIEIAGELGIEVEERTIPAAALPGFEEVFLTGSVRGVEPARALDGVDLQANGGISERLGAVLRERWFRAPNDAEALPADGRDDRPGERSGPSARLR